MKFGALLRKTRKAAGLTQEDMAFEMNISRSNISKLERDQIELKAVDLIQWGQITNATEVIAALLCGIDVATVLQSVTTLIGGLILWIF